MEIYRQVIENLKKKKELFIRYEEETEKLRTVTVKDVDMIAETIEKRQELIELINAVDDEMEEICQGPEGRKFLEAGKNQCDYAGLSPELQEVFLTGQQIFQIIDRVQKEEVYIEASLRAILEELKKLIKKNNKESKFTGYMNNMSYSTGMDKGFLYDKKR